MKKIFLVRHAKSSWKNPNLSDRHRPLNKRGKQNAPMMAERLREREELPDLIVASPAKRAQSTAKRIAKGIGYNLENIATDEMLYFQDMEGVLDVIRRTDERYQSVMVIGHNPEMTELLNNLVGFITGNMPTCAIATMEFDGDWTNLKLGGAELLSYDFPKNVIALDQL